jgi:hypothetical protein
MMDNELLDAKQIYDDHMAIKAKTGKLQMHKNMPKVSGSLKWSAELRDRVTTPMENFKLIEHPYANLIYNFISQVFILSSHLMLRVYDSICLEP